ncbi:hypothetical protein DOK67_0002059 [Enterococcus sp. DIV0212c]|uniref:DUF916 and DUF3324 domain-containing protein n=1 Tax=Enterococcus sp. DIV0212c TaxID=2230867 RepID=UPI001A9AF9EF|nr:DUF916 and DUF3324 domain-containing protein [Enterococcus sp. DIV0212c]MBO1354764.1 DUF916 and DUF3324 domain-containing protein [Enterococcus sp. DIV0212c]
MQHMKKSFYSLLSLIILLTLFTPQAMAADMDYSVSAKIPENQIDKSQSYFDLKVKPGDKQELVLNVTNSGDKEININVVPNVATTNQNGVIDFSEKDREIDSTLKYPITKILSKAQKVTVAPFEKKEVIFKLEMPKEEIPGRIVGGFYINKEEKEDKSKQSSGVQITNKYAMVVGLQLRENDEKIAPEMTLNDIKPSLINYRTSVTANLQNTKPTFLNGLKVVAKVSKKGSTEILHETTKEAMDMAPNSNFDFPINWDNQELVAGKYTMNLVASNKDDEWTFKKDFEITAKESKKLNDEAVELVKAPNYWMIGGIIAAIVVSLVIVILLIIKAISNKKRKAAMKRKQQAKKQAQQRKRKVKPEKEKK